MKTNIRKYFGLILITILGAFLILHNISDTLLWKDEAQTAQVGINTIHYGVPKVWDGTNMTASADGNSFNDDLIMTAYGWAQFYVAGISIAVLGQTTLAARLPFALISIGSIILMWFLAKQIFGKDKLSNLTALFYVLYIPFILYSRQARYYALTFFFLLSSSLLLIDFVVNETKKFTKQKYVLLAGSVMMLAFSFHLAAAIWCLSALIYVALQRKRPLFKILIPIFVGGLLWLPWFIYTIVSSSVSYGILKVDSHFLTKILINFWKTNTYFLPIVSMLILTVIFRELYLFKNKKADRSSKIKELSPGWFFALIITFNILLVSIPKWSITSHYLICVVIAAPIFLTYFFNYIKRVSPYVSVLLVCVILCSNFLHILPYRLTSSENIPDSKSEANNYLSLEEKYTTNYRLLASPVTGWTTHILPLKNYINTLKTFFYPELYANELYGHIALPNEFIIDILKEHATTGETVMVIGVEFEPIIYYTNLRVVNTLSEKVKPWQNQFSSYPNLEKFSYLTYMPDEDVDWFVIKKDGTYDYFDNPNFLKENKDKYDIYECNTADIPLSNNPDLDYHVFSTIPEKDAFYIYHKK